MVVCQQPSIMNFSTLLEELHQIEKKKAFYCTPAIRIGTKEGYWILFIMHFIFILCLLLF